MAEHPMGGIYCQGSGFLISGNTVIYNGSTPGPGEPSPYTGGIFLEVARGRYEPMILPSIIRRNIIAFNVGRHDVGLYACSSCPDLLLLESNTVAFNQAASHCAGLSMMEGSSVSNSILWGNRTPDYPADPWALGPNICPPTNERRGTKISVDRLFYNCLGEPETRGVDGNIAGDPLFVDPEALDFRLLPGSPCIDAGDPAAEPDPDGSRADIGAVPFDHRNPIFVRGDVSGDGRLNLGDAIQRLLYLLASTPVACPKAADMDDNGFVGVGDILQLLRFLFSDGPRPAPPYPAPGEDPTPDALPCGISR